MNGTWQNCDAPQPLEEICDGIDNDCNSKIDEGDACLVLHLKFDETQEWLNTNPKKVQDFSKYENHGVNSGMPHIEGKVGYGIKSEKCQDIDVPHISAMDFSNGFTIETWVFPEGTAYPNATIIQKYKKQNKMVRVLISFMTK